MNLAISSYWPALTLIERLALLRTTTTITAESINHERAARRFQTWQSQFLTPALFAQRLDTDGISAEELHTLLGSSVADLQPDSAAHPAWLTWLEQALARPTSAYPLSLPDIFQGKAASPFLDAIEPLISHAHDQLMQGIAQLVANFSELPFDPQTIGAICQNHMPWKTLVVMLGRTMALELNVARLQGVLPGHTPEERFHNFIERLRQRDVMHSIFQEYPVLARQLVLILTHWTEATLTFLQRLSTDWPALQETFSAGQQPGSLVELTSNLSDSHRRGHVVIIARFDAGLRIVYKPRCLSIDQHFQELLAWANEQEDLLPFRILQVLDRGDYGWVEYVAAGSCTSAEEVQCFYQRQGQYLALFYLLDATDIHYENLIAAGEHPVIIDVESLFHPRLEVPTPADEGAVATNADAAYTLKLPFAVRILEQTVMRTGFLPQRSRRKATNSDDVDTSALGMRSGYHWSGVLAWEHAGTDEMRLSYGQVAVTEGYQRPNINGNDVDVLAYTEAIVAGFQAMYRVLMNKCAALQAANGPIARFAEDEVRVVLRPTASYVMLLRESFHPDLLRDALERERFCDGLWQEVAQLPYLARVWRSERDDLLHGDVPIFFSHPNSRHLWDSTGQQFHNFFPQPAMTLVQQRLHNLDERDLAQQLWFIRASLATLAIGMGQGQWIGYSRTAQQAPIKRQQILAAAQAIGDRLEALALHDGNERAWIGLNLDARSAWVLDPLDIDLYDGLAGIAFFLAYLGAVTQNHRYTKLAREGVTTIQNRIQRQDTLLRSNIGLTGWGGLIYAFTHLSVLWNDPELLVAVERLTDPLPALIAQDTLYDVMSGSAGCLLCLRVLYHLTPSDQLCHLMIQCGDRLLATAQTMAEGIGWQTMGLAQPLAGLSHGAAGIAWALHELALLSGEARFQVASQAAIAYEQTLFSPTAENWYYLEGTSTKSVYGWCHGAPGIGITRLQIFKQNNDAHIKAHIATALQATLTHGFGQNHSLCHGDIGNLELLLQASDVLPNPAWTQQIDDFTAMILDSIERDGYVCGVPLGVETPGLMTGIAGIGYGLLRLAARNDVPALLVLAPPRVAAPDNKPFTTTPHNTTQW